MTGVSPVLVSLVVRNIVSPTWHGGNVILLLGKVALGRNSSTPPTKVWPDVRSCTHQGAMTLSFVTRRKLRWDLTNAKQSRFATK